MVLLAAIGNDLANDALVFDLCDGANDTAVQWLPLRLSIRGLRYLRYWLLSGCGADAIAATSSSAPQLSLGRRGCPVRRR